MIPTFSGFPKEMFSFLANLGNNNNREWFSDNKDRYENFVVEPVTRFIDTVGQLLPAISDAYAADTRRNGGSMFRIYRDTRFSRNKRPYKEHVGCQFRHFVGSARFEVLNDSRYSGHTTSLEGDPRDGRLRLTCVCDERLLPVILEVLDAGRDHVGHIDELEL